MKEREAALSIKELEDVLFDTWRKQLACQNKVFIPDGIANPKKWAKAKKRVLFLLKEVNGGDKEWDERDYLCNYNTDQQYIETHSPTISVLTQWIYAFNVCKVSKWKDVLAQTQNSEVQSELIEQIGLVNVKKVPGGGTVDGEKFDQYWSNTENIHNLREQLEIYFSVAPPHFIICGATAWYYNELFKKEKLKWEMTDRGIYYCKHGKTIVIDYCHPQARISSNIKYYALCDALQEICALR